MINTSVRKIRLPPILTENITIIHNDVSNSHPDEIVLTKPKIESTLQIKNPTPRATQKLKGVRKRPWTQIEDVLLAKLANKIGSQKWSEIAKRIKGREGKQCRERWHNHLNPDIRKDPWDFHEEWLLFLSHKIHGNKWSIMAKYINGRTDNSIKNHWNSVMKRKLNEYDDRLDQIITDSEKIAKTIGQERN